MAHPHFLSGSIGDLAQTSLQKSRQLNQLLNGVFSEDKVTVVLPDFTQPLPFNTLIPSIESSFPNMRHWLVGLGLHRTLTPSELSMLRQRTLKPILQHDPDDCCTIDEVEGQTIGVSRHLFESDWILTTGVIETHQYAGVSGGIRALSLDVVREGLSLDCTQEMVCHPKVQVGKIFHNPFRNEIERLGRLVPYTLGLMWVPSLEERWLGTPEAILLKRNVVYHPGSM